MSYNDFNLNKTQPDEWIEESHSVKSSFDIFLTKNAADPPGSHYTEVCGHGWNLWVVVSEDIDDPRQGLEIRFNPGHLANSLFGNLPVILEIFDPSGVRVKHVSESVTVNQIHLLRNSFWGSVRGHTTSLIPHWTPWPSEVPVTSPYHLVLTVTVPSEIPTPKPISPAKDLRGVTRAAAESLVSGNFADLKFGLYSKRRTIASGEVLAEPQYLYASKRALQGYCDYSDTLIQADVFKVNSGSDQLDDSYPIDSYDYDGGSDFGDDTDAHETPEAQQEADQANMGEDKNAPSSNVRTFDGRVILLNRFAYQTWKALLVYLYTGEVGFAVLSSRKERESTDTGDTNMCSPKSMYRLADMLGLADLKSLAFEAIKKDITTANVATELFSEFTNMYPDIRDFEVKFFSSHAAEEIVGLEGTLYGLCDGRANASTLLEVFRQVLPKRA